MPTLSEQGQGQAQGHGGILFPLDMFRPTMIASIIGESFIAKARNVLDAQVEMTRHPHSQLVMLRMHGSIVGDDPATFWRENVELGLILSQVLPRQLFLYYVGFDPQRQGFIVAQQGQALAGDDVDESSMPADAPAQDWPVARLADQLRLSVDELAGGFEGGPRISLPVVDVVGDDRELLGALVGDLDEQAGHDAQVGHAEAQAAPQPHAGASAEPAPAPGPAGAAPAPAPGGRPRNAKDLAAEAAADQKRRAAEREAEAEVRAALANSAVDALACEVDELGAIVAPSAELGDADILSSFVVRRLAGDVPQGMDPALTEALQGKRIDIAVKVDFFSELLLDGKPLGKADFEGAAQALEIDGLEFQAMTCLAPRLGGGALLVRGKNRVFISRELGTELPSALILKVAGIEA